MTSHVPAGHVGKLCTTALKNGSNVGCCSITFITTFRTLRSLCHGKGQAQVRAITVHVNSICSSNIFVAFPPLVMATQEQLLFT